jgi:single-strand DNA-binding protein
MSVNKAILVGNLGQDPTLRYTTSGKAVGRLSVATSTQWTGQDGEAREQTEWHAVVVSGKLVENCSQYLAKGRQVYVEGSIHTRKYVDKEGIERSFTKVIAQRVPFLGTVQVDGLRDSEESPVAELGERDFSPFDDVPF